MAKIKLIAAMVLLTAFIGQAAQAAAVELPPDAIGPDTVFVIHADAQHLSPDQLRAAVLIVLGDNADNAKDFLAKFRERYEKATAAGLESVTVISTSTQRVSDAENEVAPDPNAPPKRRNMNPPVVYFHLKAGGNAKALEKVMTQDMPAKQLQDVRFEPMDNWVVMHQKNQTPPEKVDADRTKAFADALATVSDAAVGVALIPDARMKAEMTKFAQHEGAPKLVKDSFPTLIAGKWVTLAVALGNNPGIVATANTADAQSARQLSDAVAAALDDLKQGNPGGGGGPMALIGPLMGPLVEGLKPITSGATVTCNLRGEPLNMIANLITTFRANAAPPTPPPDGKPAKPPGQ